MGSNRIVILLLGLAWPLVGLGYQAIQFGYLPSGVPLMVDSLGLLLAGIATSALLLAVRTALPTDVGRGTLLATYIMFSPVGMMAAFVLRGLLHGRHPAGAMNRGFHELSPGCC